MSAPSARLAAACCWRSSSAWGAGRAPLARPCACLPSPCRPDWLAPPPRRSGRFTWPGRAAERYPQALRDLVAACLETDPASRPSIADVKAWAQRAQLQLQA